MNKLKELLLIEQGNEQAFDNFMTRHSQRLYNYAYGILFSYTHLTLPTINHLLNSLVAAHF